MMNEIAYKPIGVIHSPHSPTVTTPRHLNRVGVEGTVEVFPEFVAGLLDLDGFSHIILLCHLHLSSGYALQVKPPHDASVHGVFATRSPRRPNPISLTVVRLKKIEGGVLHVIDLDLMDGTPVLDIKPYYNPVPASEPVVIGWMETRGSAEP